MPYQGSVLGHHIVLNYIDSNGGHHTLQGVPEHKFEHNADKLGAFLREEVWSDGANNRDSPLQRLQAQHKDERERYAAAPGQPHTLIAEGDDLSSKWDQMKRFGDDVNATGYEYRPYSQNSNSFAAGALKRAGFFGPGTAFPEISDRLIAVDPASGETGSVRVPGFDQRLANPINEPVASSNGSTPFIPANVFPARDRQNSFSDRFGGWVSSPAGNAAQDMRRPTWLPEAGDASGAASSKPERYLSRRIAGQPDASVFDAGAAAVPFVPPNQNLAPGHPASFDGRFAVPPQASRPLGIVSGKPMPDWPVRPPIWDFPDKSAASAEDSDDWLARLLRTVGTY